MGRPKGRSLSLELDNVSGSGCCVGSVWVEVDGNAFLLDGPVCCSAVSVVRLVAF